MTLVKTINKDILFFFIDKRAKSPTKKETTKELI
jgi:hypothetical protein